MESSFIGANIPGSLFDGCDLAGATFDRTNLEQVDLSSSFNYTINPTVNKLKKTVFSEQELSGLVAHLDIIIKR